MTDFDFNAHGGAPGQPEMENVGRDNIFWGNRRNFGDDDQFYNQ